MRSANSVFCLTKGNNQKTSRRQRGQWESPGCRVLVAAGDTGVGSGQSTLPSRETYLTPAGRQQLLVKSSCWLSSQSWIASAGFPQCSSGLSKGWMDGQGWPHATGSFQGGLTWVDTPSLHQNVNASRRSLLWEMKFLLLVSTWQQ